MTITPKIRQIPLAIYNALDVSAVTDLMGTYETLPTIFTSPIVPSGSPLPYIHIRLPIGIADIGTKNSNSWLLTQEILIVSDQIEDDKIYEITDIVMDLLHREILTFTTDTNLFTECIGAANVVSQDDLNALVLTFNVSIVD